VACSWRSTGWGCLNDLGFSYQCAAFYGGHGPLLSVGVLAFGDVMVDPSNFGRFSLSLYNSECFLRMDSAALQALNVMPQRVDVNDNFSLYGLMNRGKTTMSRRLLKVCALRIQLITASLFSRHWLRKSTQESEVCRLLPHHSIFPWQ
jgi:hypothetical protein